jgi:hypothetical protein
MASAATGDSLTSSVASVSPDARCTEATKAISEEAAKASNLADVTGVNVMRGQNPGGRNRGGYRVAGSSGPMSTRRNSTSVPSA